MMTAYLMICSGKRITISSKFYKVFVGSSKKDANYLRFLEKYASKRGYYLQKYDNDAADFFDKIADSLNVLKLELNYQVIKVKCLVSYINQFGNTPDMPPLSRNALKVIELFKGKYYYLNQIKVIQRAEAKQRNKPKAYSDRPQG